MPNLWYIFHFKAEHTKWIFCFVQYLIFHIYCIKIIWRKKNKQLLWKRNEVKWLFKMINRERNRSIELKAKFWRSYKLLLTYYFMFSKKNHILMKHYPFFCLFGEPMTRSTSLWQEHLNGKWKLSQIEKQEDFFPIESIEFSLFIFAFANNCVKNDSMNIEQTTDRRQEV